MNNFKVSVKETSNNTIVKFEIDQIITIPQGNQQAEKHLYVVAGLIKNLVVGEALLYFLPLSVIGRC